MIEQSLLMKLALPGTVDPFTSRLRQECEAYQHLFELQPFDAQQYLLAQAASMADMLQQGSAHIQFSLPERLVRPGATGENELKILPAKNRHQSVRQLTGRLMHGDIVRALCHRLDRLESSENQPVAIAAGLLRYAIAYHLVYRVLPAGKSVTYATLPDEDIPNQPLEVSIVPGFVSQLATWRSEAKQHLAQDEINAPYVLAARRFYMPQWVAFDDQGQLLVNTIGEAKASIASMQKYLDILKSAIEIAPYMITDEVCQQKRYGMLGQLVNQGRLLARYQLQEIIQKIRKRVAANTLNRGFSLNLPYFNDQTLKLELSAIEIIPKGRIMFVPAFVVLAVRAHGAKVAQDVNLSLSSRKYLLAELGALEKEFMRL